MTNTIFQNNVRTWRRRAMVAILPLALMLTGAGCSPFGSAAPKAPPPVGIYKSSDRGDTWTTKNTILNPSPPSLGTLNNTNVVSLVFDPTDRSTLYLGSEAQGLYYTYSEAASWFASSPIRSQAILSIAVSNNPNDRCTIYIAAANKMFKTVDCGRHWDQVYIDTRSDILVESIAIHRSNDQIVYAGLSTGDILSSKDGGATWETIARLGDEVRAIVPHTLNDQIIYAALRRKGMRKTVDGGTTWTDISTGLKDYSGSMTINDLTIDPSRPETIILATDYGLVRTTDGGDTWSALPLITPAGKIPIVAVALDPTTPANIYYTTDTTLYRSTNAGQTWETKPLPVSGVRTKLLVDPKEPSTLYLGVYRVQQQSNSFGL